MLDENNTPAETGTPDDVVPVQTTRWGIIDVPGGDLIDLPGGLLGLESGERFVLVRPGDDATFFWLQSTSRPDVAMVVTDPTWFHADYSVELREETRRDLGLAPGEDASVVQTLVVVNKVSDATGEWLTGNLMGPILVNTLTRRGRQVVLGERKWGMRQPLLQLAPAVSAKSA